MALLPASGALTAFADDGRPLPSPAGRPPSPIPFPASELRPTEIQHGTAPSPAGQAGPGLGIARQKELVIFVGGYGSQADDGGFDQLAANFDPRRFDVVRFGADPRFRYDTYDSIDRSAAALTDEIRTIGSGYSGVNIVSHSMGGAVVDRAFANGLSAADGVRTDVAIAGPHSGDDFARAPTVILPWLGPVKEIVRAAGVAVARDPQSAAARDLASTRPVAPPRGVVRLDVSLATDGFVSERNARDPGVPQRVFLPASIGEAVDGHGGSLTNHEIGAVVTETVRSHAIPPDRRDLPTLLLTPIVWPLAAHLWLRLLAAAVALSIGLALVRQFTPLRGRIDWFARRCTGYLRLRGR